MLSIIFGVFFILWIQVANQQNTLRERAKLSFPDEVPTELYDLPIEKMVTYGEHRVTLKFPTDKTSIEGHWYGMNATVQIVCEAAIYAGVPKRTTDYWGDYLQYQTADSTMSPELTVELPIAETNLHQMLTIKSNMTIVYPRQIGANFVNGAADLSCEDNRFVVSPEEIKIKWDNQQYNLNTYVQELRDSEMFLATYGRL
jgi:hypothetical protein